MTSTLIVPRLFIRIACLLSLIFILFITSAFAAREGSRYNYKQVAIINDLPEEDDLTKYLEVLEKAIFFVNMHKYYVDMSLSFGIFLADVNLRAIVKHRLSEPLRGRFGHLLECTEAILEYFYKTVLNHKKEHREMLRPLLSLYMNNTAWLSNLQDFNFDLLRSTHFYFREDLDERYSKWSKYKKNIYINTADPNPLNGDDCFNLLAQNPVYDSKKDVICHVPFSCSNFALNGTDFGYGMKNRLLLSIVARFSRGCTFGYLENHKQFVDELCAQIYNEAEYIAFHDFQEPNLILEHIVLCSLLGHAQFLRESWLDELVDFQTAVGCFNTVRPTEDNAFKDVRNTEMKDWEFLKTRPTIWAGSCYRNITGAGIAMLASVLRYIVEARRSMN